MQKKSFGHLQGSFNINKKLGEKLWTKKRLWFRYLLRARNSLHFGTDLAFSVSSIRDNRQKQHHGSSFPLILYTHQKGSPAAAILPLVLYSAFPLSLLLSLNHLSANSQKFFCFALHKNTQTELRKKNQEKGFHGFVSQGLILVTRLCCAQVAWKLSWEDTIGGVSGSSKKAQKNDLTKKSPASSWDALTVLPFVPDVTPNKWTRLSCSQLCSTVFILPMTAATTSTFQKWYEFKKRWWLSTGARMLLLRLHKLHLMYLWGEKKRP